MYGTIYILAVDPLIELYRHICRITIHYFNTYIIYIDMTKTLIKYLILNFYRRCLNYRLVVIYLNELTHTLIIEFNELR